MSRVAVGIGCRAGSSADDIEAAIRTALARYALAAAGEAARAETGEVAVVATLDAKADEPGLVACCARHAWPIAAFTRAQLDAALARASRHAFSAPSAPARERFGIDGVCEPCALLAAPNGTLLIPKTIVAGVTVALAGPL